MAPNFHLHGNNDDDRADTISEQWHLDGQEQEPLISLRDARKKLQHVGKSIDELKKVTPTAELWKQVHRKWRLIKCQNLSCLLFQKMMI